MFAGRQSPQQHSVFGKEVPSPTSTYTGVHSGKWSMSTLCQYIGSLETATKHAKLGVHQATSLHPQLARVKEQFGTHGTHPMSPPLSKSSNNILIGKAAIGIPTPKAASACTESTAADSQQSSPRSSPRSSPPQQKASLKKAKRDSVPVSEDSTVSPLNFRAANGEGGFEQYFAGLSQEDRGSLAKSLFHTLCNVVAATPERTAEVDREINKVYAAHVAEGQRNRSGPLNHLCASPGVHPPLTPGDSSPRLTPMMSQNRLLVARVDGSFRVATEEETVAPRNIRRGSTIINYNPNESSKSFKLTPTPSYAQGITKTISMHSMKETETESDVDGASQPELYGTIELPPASSHFVDEAHNVLLTPLDGDLSDDPQDPDDDDDHHGMDFLTPYDRGDSPMLGLGSRGQFDSFLSIANHNVVDTDQVIKGEDTDGNKRINQYTVIGDLGRGSYAKVKLVMHEETDAPYALKIMNKSMLKRIRKAGGTALEQTRVELAIMKKIAHPRIVRLHEVIDDPKADKMYLIMDYVDGGVIAEITDAGHCDIMDPKKVAHYLRQIASALGHLHRHNIVHRDIKPSNILVDGNEQCYLCDFGVSSVITDTNSDVEGLEGTPFFFSPELCEGMHVFLTLCQLYSIQYTTGNGVVNGKASDMWALGVTAFGLLLGTLPFLGETRAEIMEAIQNDSVTIPASTDPDVRSLLRGMLNKSPKKRMTLPELKVHPFVASRGERHPSIQYNESIVISVKDMLNAFCLGDNARPPGDLTSPTTMPDLTFDSPNAIPMDESMHLPFAEAEELLSSVDNTLRASQADSRGFEMSGRLSLGLDASRTLELSRSSRRSSRGDNDCVGAAAKMYIRRYVETVRSRVIMKKSERIREKRAEVRRRKEQERLSISQRNNDTTDTEGTPGQEPSESPNAETLPCVSVQAPTSPATRWSRENLGSLSSICVEPLPLTEELLRERDAGQMEISVASSLSQTETNDTSLTGRKRSTTSTTNGFANSTNAQPKPSPALPSAGPTSDASDMGCSPPLSLTPAPPQCVSPTESPRGTKRHSVFDVSPLSVPSPRYVDLFVLHQQPYHTIPLPSLPLPSPHPFPFRSHNEEEMLAMLSPGAASTPAVSTPRLVRAGTYGTDRDFDTLLNNLPARPMSQEGGRLPKLKPLDDALHRPSLPTALSPPGRVMSAAWGISPEPPSAMNFRMPANGLYVVLCEFFFVYFSFSAGDAPQ